MKFNFRESLFRIWYWYVNKVDKNAEVLFMNYGFAEKDQSIPLDEKNEPNRYSIQLYHHLASATEIKNKDIVEIGCGRGGGLSYITKSFSPATAKGIDLDKQAASFCNRHYKLDGLSFAQGDAQNLSLEDNAYDVVINVESSHRYPDKGAFLGEVSRILRPDGYFLFTDFRYDYEIEEMKKQLDSSGLTVLKERFITQEVVTALKFDDERRRKLIKKLAPKFLHKIALNFAGTIGSETYNQFASGKYVYFSYVLQKQ
ncbi:MAG: class I SAM-dependent methyltransferase [Bacteroidales bacterium]|nr:class I SAM-dependent methyltransferase [Bacteroidales bacterium]